MFKGLLGLGVEKFGAQAVAVRSTGPARLEYGSALLVQKQH